MTSTKLYNFVMLFLFKHVHEFHSYKLIFFININVGDVQTYFDFQKLEIHLLYLQFLVFRRSFAF